MDSQASRKRGREPEALPDSSDVREPKRLELGEETNLFPDLLQLDKNLAEEQEEECANNEEIISSFMRNMEEEIAAPCSTYFLSDNYGDDSAASDICRDHKGKILDSDVGIDLAYLLDASDDELGIPSSPALDLKDEVCLTRKETSAGLSENPDLNSLGENWLFEDDFEDYQQFAMYNDAWNASQLQNYMNADFISPDTLFF